MLGRTLRQHKFAMPVVLVGNAELPLSSLLFVGKVTRCEALSFPEEIDTHRADIGSRWINIFDSAADLSDIDPDCLMQIKAKLKAVIPTLSTKGEFKAVLVSQSRYNDPLMACWRAMTATDQDYPSDPDTVMTVAAACAAHGFSPVKSADCEAWLRRQLEAARARA